MNKLIVAAFVALGAGAVLLACELGSGPGSAAVATAVAQEPAGPKGCTLVGTWVTTPASSPVQWINTMNGASSSGGTGATEVFQWPNLTLALPPDPPAFPAAVRMSTLRGVWERTGGNTFAFTQLGHALDAAGNVVYVVRNSGSDTVKADCDEMLVESTLEFFAPNQNPVEDEPFVAFPIDPMTAFRVEVEPPPTFP